MKNIFVVIFLSTTFIGNIFGQYQDSIYIFSQLTLGGTHSTIHHKAYAPGSHQITQLYGGFGNEWRLYESVIQLNFAFEVSSQLANSLENNIGGDIAPTKKWSMSMHNHYMGKFKKQNHQLGGGLNIKLDVNGKNNLPGEYAEYSSLVWAIELGPTYIYDTYLAGKWLRLQAHLPVTNFLSDNAFFVYADSGYTENILTNRFQTINRYFSPDLRLEWTIFENKAGANCAFIYNFNFTYFKYDNSSPDVRDLSHTAGLKIYFGLDPDMSLMW